MELIGKNIRLRPFKKEDSVRMTELLNNKNIWDNLPDSIPYPFTEKDAEDFVSKHTNEFPRVTFAIEFEGELAGCVLLKMQKDVQQFSAEIGYWVGEPYWNKGIATEAVNLLTEHGFSYLSLNRIYAAVYDFNKGSQKVLEKSGYELEGIFKDAVFKNNKFCDDFRYAKVQKIEQKSDGLLDNLL